jgi:hypothetical protein
MTAFGVGGQSHMVHWGGCNQPISVGRARIQIAGRFRRKQAIKAASNSFEHIPHGFKPNAVFGEQHPKLPAGYHVVFLKPEVNRLLRMRP